MVMVSLWSFVIQSGWIAGGQHNAIASSVGLFMFIRSVVAVGYYRNAYILNKAHIL